MKFRVIFFLAFAAVLATGGCARSNRSQDFRTLAAQEQIAWKNPSDDNVQAFGRLADEFVKKYPGTNEAINALQLKASVSQAAADRARRNREQVDAMLATP